MLNAYNNTHTDAAYSPSMSSVLSVTIFACSFVASCWWSPPMSAKSLLVWSTAALSVFLGAFGLHCHYRGTYGYAAVNQNEMLPVFLFGAIFASYAAGPLRLTEAFVHQTMPSGITDDLTFGTLKISVTWATLFVVTHVMPGLINHIGLGCVLWFLMVNSALAALFFHKTLANVEKSGNHNSQQFARPVVVIEEKRTVVDQTTGISV